MNAFEPMVILIQKNVLLYCAEIKVEVRISIDEIRRTIDLLSIGFHDRYSLR